MKPEVLAKKFTDRAELIEASGRSSAIYRARSYDRVAAVILSNHDNVNITEDSINELGLSDYMTGIATDLLNGKALKAIKKSKSKVKSTVNLKPKVKSTVKSTVKSKVKSKVKLLNQLVGFMGIGKVLSQTLIDDGLTNINQLHMTKWQTKLPLETQLYLKLKPMQNIPYADIAKLEKKLVNGNSVIVGSYRRKKATSRDIDIMLVSKDEDAIAKYLKKLKTKLAVYPYSQGHDKMSMIIKSKQLIYKLDVFRVLPENRIPMLLYATGSKEFNIRMRSVAKAKGYLLNQKGLFKKQSNGETRRVPNLNSEKDYFRVLSMDYLEPSKR